jgi:hypothetical protein
VKVKLLPKYWLGLILVFCVCVCVLNQISDAEIIFCHWSEKCRAGGVISCYAVTMSALLPVVWRYKVLSAFFQLFVLRFKPSDGIK